MSEITSQKSESRLSQVFIAIDIRKLGNYAAIQTVIERIIDDYHLSIPVEGGKAVRYPGEQVVATRRQNIELGIPVQDQVWDEIKRLL